jgi:hypothetical protein
VVQCLSLVGAFVHFPTSAIRGICNPKTGCTGTALSMAVLNPPSTFLDCVKQAKDSVKAAMADGHTLIEVEFPPLPLEYLEDSASSARDIADANTRWSVEFAKSFTKLGKVSIIYPDQPELDDAMKFVEGGEEKDKLDGINPYPNITLGTIRTDSIKNARSLDQILLSIFGATVAGTVGPIENTAMYIAVVSSTQELPDLEKLHNLDPSIPIVFFNLRLDVLRGDLGLPLFPGRDLHHRFLSQIKPAYFMKSRSFATSLRRPPFIVNFSGLLYRSYPQQYQSILNTGSGKNKVVFLGPDRPTNLDFRNNLSGSLKIQGVPKEELITGGNLVWWEKDQEKDASPNWRL